MRDYACMLQAVVRLPLACTVRWLTHQKWLAIDHVTEALVGHEGCEAGMLHAWLLQLHHTGPPHGKQASRQVAPRGVQCTEGQKWGMQGSA